jgi:hypothetical protein
VKGREGSDTRLGGMAETVEDSAGCTALLLIVMKHPERPVSDAPQQSILNKAVECFKALRTRCRRRAGKSAQSHSVFLLAVQFMYMHTPKCSSVIS